MKLYEYSAAIEDAYDRGVDPETGEVVDEQAWAELEALQMERDERLEGVALWVKDLSAEATAIKAEEEALKKRRQTAEKKAESLRRYLAYVLRGEKLKTPRVAIGWRRSEVVELAEGLDPATLPIDFQRVKVTVDVDKAKLKEALKKGIEIAGVTLEERQNIQIK